MTYLADKSVLVTGGTGSFGKAFIRRLLSDFEPRRVVVFSRDELKQYEFRQELGDDPRLRWFIGDVRDRARLEQAFNGVEVVVHPGSEPRYALITSFESSQILADWIESEREPVAR